MLYTDLTTTLVTDLLIGSFTFSKPDCGLSSYSIVGAAASIYNTNNVRFVSNAENVLNFSLVVTAIGDLPATLNLATTIKIVDCSNNNIISGGTWNQNQLFTDLTTALTTNLQITPFTYSKPDCGLLAYSIIGVDASIVLTNEV